MLHLPTATVPSIPTVPTAPVVPDLHFALGYPARWDAPENPHAARVDAHLRAWFRALGVAASPAAEARLAAMDLAGYGGLPFPLASPAVLETVTGLLSLWIVHDDAIEGHGDDDGAVLLRALAGAPARGPEVPVVQAYRALGARLGGMSAAWRRRHVADFAAWLVSVDDEAGLAARFRTGATITVAEHLAVREINVGMIPVIDWIEHDLGRELPAALHAHPAMARVVRAASHAVAFTNELYGYTKDREAGWINAVACAEREDAAAPAHAFARIIDLHDGAVAEVIESGHALVAAAPGERALVTAWLHRLHLIIAGFARWHARAPRYRADHLAGGARLHLRRGVLPS